VVAYDDSKPPLTESSPADLFLRYGKYGNQLYHYLRNNIHHERVQGDLAIDMKTFEEVSKVFEEVEEGVIARAYSVSSLESFEDQIESAREGGHAR
jgi:hypothetical protein